MWLLPSNGTMHVDRLSLQNQKERQRDIDERIVRIGTQITSVARKQVQRYMKHETSKYIKELNVASLRRIARLFSLFDKTNK
jgi:hypothetical protein